MKKWLFLFYNKKQQDARINAQKGRKRITTTTIKARDVFRRHVRECISISSKTSRGRKRMCHVRRADDVKRLWVGWGGVQVRNKEAIKKKVTERVCNKNKKNEFYIYENAAMNGERIRAMRACITCGQLSQRDFFFFLPCVHNVIYISEVFFMDVNTRRRCILWCGNYIARAWFSSETFFFFF